MGGGIYSTSVTLSVNFVQNSRIEKNEPHMWINGAAHVDLWDLFGPVCNSEKSKLEPFAQKSPKGCTVD